jgi:prolyl-tRNA synthetase
LTKPYARTEDTHDENHFLQVPEGRRIESKAIEVGQIFYFGTKYSEPMKAFVVSPDGKRVPVHMGSHGIGVSRLVGAIIEASHDEKGIIWPEPVAPFFAGLINLNYRDEDCIKVCDQVYEKLGSNGIEILYDDTDERPGSKFAKMDLIGLPWQIVVGPKGIKEGKLELVHRRTGETTLLLLEELLEKISTAHKALVEV